MEIQQAFTQSYRQSDQLLLSITSVYRNLKRISPFEIDAYGPPKPDAVNVSKRRVTTTGAGLQHASTNAKQGIWLSRLSAYCAANHQTPIHVVELGTCAGISAMYLLAGMSNGCGGHLTTFEGSAELAALARKHIDGFIERFNLSNVTYEVVVGPIDETFHKWLALHKQPLTLAFVDGNHQEANTLNYHAMIREHSRYETLIVHDDISWGEGMKNAWRAIQNAEATAGILEFRLGGKPSRGLITHDQRFLGLRESVDMDGALSRWARRAKARLKV